MKLIPVQQQHHYPRRFDGSSDRQSCGISIVYSRPPSKRVRYLIAAKHVSYIRENIIRWPLAEIA